MSDLGMRLTAFPDTIDLQFDATDLPDDGRHEPLFAALRAADVDEPRRLDPARSDFGPVPAPAGRSIWRGPASSLLLHLLPLLILIGWPKTPVEVTPPIPIQFVIEQPPPPPPEPPKPAPVIHPPPPLTGLRASDDYGALGASKLEKGEAAAPPAPVEPPPVTETQSAPTPEPTQPTEQVTEAPQPKAGEASQLAEVSPPPLPKSAPPKHQAAVRMPKPDGWLLPLDGERPQQASHSARLPGPDATRDEYCAYVLGLTMRHIDLLPLSLLGARRGDTYVTIKVLADGTISSARVAHGSGYSDIDDRVAQMVLAVGRFPPLPQWIQSGSMDFIFHLHFPQPAER
jgi:TonB family protein